jgi:hypothetical protein
MGGGERTPLQSRDFFEFETTPEPGDDDLADFQLELG